MKSIILKYYEYLCEIFDSKNYLLESHTQLKTVYTFNIGEHTYRVFFNALKDGHYHLSFSLFNKENGLETYELLKNSKHGIKVLSNVKNIVDEFLKIQKVDMLVYESFDIEREYVYMRFAQHLKLSHFDNYYTKDYNFENNKVKLFILVNLNTDYRYYLNNDYIDKNITKLFKK